MTKELPQGWVRATLGELGVEAQTGFASGKHNSGGNGVLHLRPMNITREGRLSVGDARYVDDSSDRRVHPGDVLFNNTNSPALTGKTALVTTPEPVAYSNHMTRLRPPAGIDAAFLAMQLHALWMNGYFKSVLNNHVNQASVASGKLLETPIVIPPLAEQLRIVANLDDQLSRLDMARKYFSAGEDRVNALLRSVLNRAASGNLVDFRSPESGERLRSAALAYRVGVVPKRRLKPSVAAMPFPAPLPAHWAVAALDELTTSIEYGTSAKTQARELPSDVPVLRMGNIQDGRLDIGALKFLPANHADVAKLLLVDGDLLFNRTNSAELVGKTAVYRAHLGPMTFASYLIRCQFAPGVIPEWVSLVINSGYGRQYISAVSSQQVGQANVNGTKLAAMPIPLPPTDEQERILSAVDDFKTKADHFSGIFALSRRRGTTMRGSLLAAALSGELVRQDPNDEPASALLERIKAEQLTIKRPSRGRRAPRALVAPERINLIPSGTQEELPL